MTAINSIKVFSRATCAPCKTVKMILTEKKKLAHDTIDVDENPEEFEQVIRLSGSTITPQVLIQKTIDGEEVTDVIVGYNPTKLFGI